MQVAFVAMVASTVHGPSFGCDFFFRRDDRHREIAERVFRTLTVREPDGQDIQLHVRFALEHDRENARARELETQLAGE